jgi:hypothetical protein
VHGDQNHRQMIGEIDWKFRAEFAHLDEEAFKLGLVAGTIVKVGTERH